MINLYNGSITFESNAIILSNELNKKEFLIKCPQDRILNIHDMNNGYVWYKLKEQLYRNEHNMIVSMCFAPSNSLFCIHIYPLFDDCLNKSWKDASYEQMQKEKEYCDYILLKYCNLTAESHKFPWGIIVAEADNRNLCSSIIINYN